MYECGAFSIFRLVFKIDGVKSVPVPVSSSLLSLLLLHHCHSFSKVVLRRLVSPQSLRIQQLWKQSSTAVFYHNSSVSKSNCFLFILSHVNQTDFLFFLKTPLCGCITCPGLHSAVEVLSPQNPSSLPLMGQTQNHRSSQTVLIPQPDSLAYKQMNLIWSTSFFFKHIYCRTLFTIFQQWWSSDTNSTWACFAFSIPPAAIQKGRVLEYTFASKQTSCHTTGWTFTALTQHVEQHLQQHLPGIHSLSL